MPAAMWIDAVETRNRKPMRPNPSRPGNFASVTSASMDLARHPDFGIVFIGAPLDEVGDLQPYLVAEVASASSKKRDYQEKRQDSLEYGIREYWIVDPVLRQLTLFEPPGRSERHPD